MIIEGKEESKEVDDIDFYFLGLLKPKSFTGSGSYEIQFELNFETLCHSLAEHSNGREIKTMTVLEVYSLMLLIKKKEKPNVRR